MRLKCRDKQQQKYQHGVGMSMVQRPSLNITPLSSVSHTDAGTTSADATDFYTCNRRTVAAAYTLFTAAATAFTAAPDQLASGSSSQPTSRSAIADNFYRPFSGPPNLQKTIN